MANVTVRKRLTEWWREPGEVSEDAKLNEAYDPSRLKPGLDGKNGPDVKKMYATEGDVSPGGLGSGQKTSRGSSDPKDKNTKVTAESKKPAQRKVQEEFEDESGDLDDSLMDDEFEGEMGGDVNPESDIPPEMDDMAGDEAVADDIRVTIGGQEYILVPATDGADMGGEMGDVGAEMDDVSQPPMDDEMGGEMAPEEEPKPQLESKKTRKSADYSRMIDEALEAKGAKAQNEKTQKVAAALAMIEKAKKELNELFTGDYVQNKGSQKDAGFDFSDVRGSTDFAVVARAASGKQYTPSKSDGEQEPSGDGSGGSKKEAFKAWLAAQKAKIEESDSDPGQDSEEFNDKDTMDHNIGGIEKFPEVPETIGADPKVLSQYAKTAEARKARQAQAAGKMKESEQPVKFPSKEVKSDIEQSLDESFDFKKFIRGEYKA